MALLAERYGQAMGPQQGFVASIRRHLSNNMQAPGAKDTSSYFMTPYLENVPLTALTSLLDTKYWTKSGDTMPATDGCCTVRFKTDSSKAIGMLYDLESLSTSRLLAIGCGKLVRPPGTAAAVYILIAQPPGEIVHRTRSDQSSVIEACFNFATLNEVPPHYPSSHPARPAQLRPHYAAAA